MRPFSKKGADPFSLADSAPTVRPMGMNVRREDFRDTVVIASDQRERGNLTVVALKNCEIASASPRNDTRDFQNKTESQEDVPPWPAVFCLLTQHSTLPHHALGSSSLRRLRPNHPTPAKPDSSGMTVASSTAALSCHPPHGILELSLGGATRVNRGNGGHLHSRRGSIPRRLPRGVVHSSWRLQGPAEACQGVVCLRHGASG